MMLLAGTFILCWTPYAVLAVMAILGTLISIVSLSVLTLDGGDSWVVGRSDGYKLAIMREMTRSV